MKKYWQSIEEYKHSLQPENRDKPSEPEPGFSIEGLTPDEIKGKASRRDFLKMLGFTVGYAAIATSCETPVRKAIPYLNKPDELVPGISNYYASTFFDGKDYCSILVKNREGRPIKIEGNELSPISAGSTSARVQSSVLSLYDDARYKGPLKNKEQSDWAVIDQEIIERLEKTGAGGKKIAILTSTVISPATRHLLAEFRDKYPSAEWVTYDTISASAMLQANAAQFGVRAIPTYHFDKAELIVGFNADFLGNWLSPIEYARQYASGRNLIDENSMSRHLQYESGMSLTGANADKRFPIKPSEQGAILLNLYNKLASKNGSPEYPAPSTRHDIDALADELLEHKGKSLVVSGSNDYPVQLIVNAINALLGNYQQTIDLSAPMYIRQGDDMDMTALVNDMHSGRVGAIIMNNVNPVYDFTGMKDFAEGLGKVDLVVSTADRKDETAGICEYVCPDTHYLESWNDAEPRKGHYSMVQPAIRKIFDTRQFQDSMLRWMGREENYTDYLEKYWEQEMFPRQDRFLSFSDFWHHCVHDGVWKSEGVRKRHPDYFTTPLKAEKPNDNGLELVLYEKMGIGCGRHANNPWLQELPDPISTAVWDNYICIPPKYAEENDIEQEDVLSIDGQVELPALIQPGQAEGTIAVALGYGRTVAGKVAEGIGKNMYPFTSYAGSNRVLSGKVVQLSKVDGKTYPLATTQTHHTMEGRPLVRETTLEQWQEKPNSGNEMHMNIVEQNLTLYEIPVYDAFHWGMAINLNSCIGCGNCVISCQAENNVAVIGKEEIRNRRVMHWMRLDRYYSDNADNPEVVHQPVLCQHCDNAPCENVCPVAATPHNDEGLNQMAYNRCIGTRYCMNNCPYKVRRFNWFEFSNNDEFNFNMNSEQEKLVLNPDVTVRSRGVVEKCSFCVQRIQEKKLVAKKEGRQLGGNEVKTACQQSCPGNAIVFGNMNDPDSEISKLMTNPRTYQLLEQLHTLPSVSYMTKVRNKEKILDSSARAAGPGNHSSH